MVYQPIRFEQWHTIILSLTLSAFSLNKVPYTLPGLSITTLPMITPPVHWDYCKSWWSTQTCEVSRKTIARQEPTILPKRQLQAGEFKVYGYFCNKWPL